MDMSPARLRDLVVRVREELDIEVKCWLDLSNGAAKADLAQAILALANHGGGYVVIGFEEVAGQYRPAPARQPLAQYSQDAVNGIVDRYAAPKFHCDVRIVEDDAGEEYPIVVVPGGHTVPVRAARGGPNNQHVQQNVYYIRRHGPRSEAPQTPEEWDALIRRCVRNSREDFLDSIRAVLDGTPLPAADALPASALDDWESLGREAWKSLLDSHAFPEDHAARFPLGSCTFSYQLIGELRPLSLRDFKRAMAESEGHETGWPEWMMSDFGILPPSPSGNASIECCLASLDRSDPSDCDYWRARMDGLALLMRGYQEDGGSRDFAAGTLLDAVVPVWRVGEALLHSERLASHVIEGPAQARLRATWTGLQGRRLGKVGELMIGLPHQPSRVDVVVSELEYPMEAVRDTLPELVGKFLEPLHASFDFYQMSPQLISKEVDSLRRLIAS